MPVSNLDRRGGQSGSSVITEPFDHLIQHIKQDDPRLYEALKRVMSLQQNFTDITNLLEPPPLAPVRDPEKIKCIIPGLATVVDDVATNRYNVELDEDKKLLLEWCTITAKTSPPLTGDYEIDWLRSNDNSGSFISLFPDGDRPTLLTGVHKVRHVRFAIIELFNNDELRFDVKQANGANNMESNLKGKIVDR